MCRFNISFNDAVVSEMRPHFKDEESLIVWMEVSMEHLMREYIARFKRPSGDGEAMLNKIKELPNTPEGFLQLGGILGRQEASFSWEELREEAYSEKYGI